MKNWIDLVGNAQKSSTRIDEKSLSSIFKPTRDPRETDEETATRRLADVTNRANNEKKTYGFLRSLAKKPFGKKTKEPRTDKDRLSSIVNRAKSEGQSMNESISDDTIENDYTIGWATRDQFEHVLDGLMANDYIYFTTTRGERETTYHVMATPEIHWEITKIYQDIDDGER